MLVNKKKCRVNFADAFRSFDKIALLRAREWYLLVCCNKRKSTENWVQLPWSRFQFSYEDHQMALIYLLQINEQVTLVVQLAWPSTEFSIFIIFYFLSTFLSKPIFEQTVVYKKLHNNYICHPESFRVNCGSVNFLFGFSMWSVSDSSQTVVGHSRLLIVMNNLTSA